MNFEYSLDIPAPYDHLWNLLEDIPRAARLMSGVDCMKAHDDGSYGAVLRIRIGPIGFNLSGTLRVTTDQHSGRWTMTVHAQDARTGGGVASTVETTIQERNQLLTNMTVKAKVQFLGRLGQLGQPLIKKKADSMVQDFTENLKNAAIADI